MQHMTNTENKEEILKGNRGKKENHLHKNNYSEVDLLAQ